MKQKLTFPELREQAIVLRLAGKSRREIKEILGIGSNETLDKALRGVAPPPWTRRPRAKDEPHEKARALRATGRTYTEIAAELGVSKSSVSLWVRDMPRQGRLNYAEYRRRNADGVSKYWRSIRESRRHAAYERAIDEIGLLSDREVLIAGAVAYWCEGAKSKVNRHQDRVTFINSDPNLILFFLRFLAVANVAPDSLICRLYIHENADVAAAEEFWRSLTCLPVTQFRKPVLKHHNPRTVRKNTGENYRGCLKVDVRCSASLYRQIEGWAAVAMRTADK
jgi:transcriptional regulator with XRE-family HTH domain